MAAIHTVNLSELLRTPRFDLLLEGGKQKMNSSFQGSMEDHKKILLAEDWI